MPAFVAKITLQTTATVHVVDSSKTAALRYLRRTATNDDGWLSNVEPEEELSVAKIEVKEISDLSEIPSDADPDYIAWGSNFDAYTIVDEVVEQQVLRERGFTRNSQIPDDEYEEFFDEVRRRVNEFWEVWDDPWATRG